MAESAEPRPPVSTPLAVIIGLCFAVAMVEGYDLQSMGVAAPRLVKAIGLSAAQLGLVLTASMLGLIAGALLGGRLADRLGRKPVLIGSVAAFGVFSLATVLARDHPALLAARAATGLGLGGAMPNLIAIAADIAGDRRRGAINGLIFAGLPLGGAAAALLVVLTLKDFDWRLVFLVGGALPLIIAPLLAAALPETLPTRAPGVGRSATPYGRILFGEGRATTTVTLWTAFILTLVVLYLLVNWLPLLVVAKGLSPKVAPVAAIALNLAGVVGSVVLAALVDRFGMRGAMLVAYLALIASLAGLAGAGGLSPILAWSGAAGFLVMGAQFVLYGAAPTYYPRPDRGAGAGAAVGVGRIGSLIGPFAAGVMISPGMTAEAVVLSMTPVVAVAGLALLGLTLTRPRSGD